jgi:hypothetical protein
VSTRDSWAVINRLVILSSPAATPVNKPAVSAKALLFRLPTAVGSEGTRVTPREVQD